MSADLPEKILAERPKFHRGDTETKVALVHDKTFLRGSSFDSITENRPGDYDIESAVARFIYDSVPSTARLSRRAREPPHSSLHCEDHRIPRSPLTSRKSMRFGFTHGRTRSRWSASSLSSNLRIHISRAARIKIWTSCSSMASTPSHGPSSIGFTQRIS